MKRTIKVRYSPTSKWEDANTTSAAYALRNADKARRLRTVWIMDGDEITAYMAVNRRWRKV